MWNKTLQQIKEEREYSIKKEIEDKEYMLKWIGRLRKELEEQAIRIDQLERRGSWLERVFKRD